MTALQAANKIQRLLGFAGEDVDGDLGPKSLERFMLLAELARSMPAWEWPEKPGTGRILTGDGTWPWTAQIDGEDIVIKGARMTCWGGPNDPDDSGETASGISTIKEPDLVAFSLPMDGRQFTGLTPAEQRALNGSPIPRLGTWPKNARKSRVIVTRGALSVEGPVIDLGPGKRTKCPVDATTAAARKFNPKATPRNFSLVVDVRILGAAKFA